jgi:16S rRNA (guanine527-N7)-methyltransferase
MAIMEKLKDGAKKLGLQLSAQQLEKFQIFYRELIDWNKKVNLTRITDYEEVQVKHFLDSLTVTLGMQPIDEGKVLNVIDIGTGAGLPGIPLKIVFPNINLTLLEATAKKAKFLEHIVGRLGLDKVEIVVGRAEETAHDAQYRERYDVALSRAVATLPTLVELTLPFCIVGGRCVTQKKGDIDREVERALKVIAVMGGR